VSALVPSPLHALLWRRRPRGAETHILAVIVGGLALDQVFGWPGQIAASLWAAAVFGWLYSRGGVLERRVLVACMAIAGVGECVLSLVWGLYDYRFHNIPAFVPPGHALLMTLGVMVLPRVPDWSLRLVPAVAGVWALAGLWQGWDAAGAGLFLLLVLCMAVSRGRPLYAVMFVLALAMELYGTWLGCWTWKPLVPGLGLTTTNPPVHAGAFYCALDLLVLVSLRLGSLASAAADDGAPISADGRTSV